jgi:hypothetical protein
MPQYMEMDACSISIKYRSNRVEGRYNYTTTENVWEISFSGTFTTDRDMNEVQNQT